MTAAAGPARFALVVDEWFDGEQRHGAATLRVADGRLVGTHARAPHLLRWELRGRIDEHDTDDALGSSDQSDLVGRE